MSIDQFVYHRRSIRLENYDYSQPGAYFVTLITHYKAKLFGEIVENQVHLNQIGQIIHTTWVRLPRFFAVKHDEWVIMPNHLHGIIWILDHDTSKGEAFADNTQESNKAHSTNASPLPKPIGTQHGSLAAIIQNFKSVSTRKIYQRIEHARQGQAFGSQANSIPKYILSNASPLPVWQRNYYERIIRNQRELDSIRTYIIDNPRKWMEDEEYHG